MKKQTAFLLAALLLCSLCSCKKNESDENFDLSTTEAYTDDDYSYALSYSVSGCTNIYGDYVVYTVRNYDETDSVVLGGEIIYKHTKSISAIKTADEKHICVYNSDDLGEFTLLDVESGAVENIRFDIESDDELLRSEPYFSSSRIFIAASLGVAGQGEPSCTLFSLDKESGKTKMIAENCVCFQVLPDGLLYSTDGSEIVFVDNDFSAESFSGYELDSVFSVLSGKYNISVDTEKKQFKITDVFTSKSIAVSADEDSLVAGITSAVVTQKYLIYLTKNGIHKINLNTDKSETVTNDVPESFAASENAVCYIVDEQLKCVSLISDYVFADENVSCCKENNVLTLEDAKLITDDCNVLLTNDTFLPKVYKKKNGSVYSVFEIENYGRMYVTYDTADSEEMSRDNMLFVVNKSRKDFETLTVGVSTYEDVRSMDELAGEIVGGNFLASIHFLNDGYTATVKYSTFNPDGTFVSEIDFEESGLEESFFEADLY